MSIKFKIDLGVILFLFNELDRLRTQSRHLDMVVYNLLNIDEMTLGLGDLMS